MIPVMSGSAHITTHANSMPYVVADNTNPTMGMLRTNSGQLQVFNGTWTTTNVASSVGMSPEAESAIQWAIDQMRREARLKEMAAQHPAVADALRNRDRAQDALDIVLRLCGELEQ